MVWLGVRASALSLCLLLLIALGRASPARNRALAVRQTADDVAKVKGGVLTKNGKITACGVVMLTNKIAVVSADCLDYNDSVVDWSTKYRIYISKGDNGLTGSYEVAKLDVHPKYDPVTKANNIAVVRIQLDAVETWTKLVAIGSDKWSTVVYAQLILSNMTDITWDKPNIYVRDNVGGDDVCISMSPLYAANRNNYMCTQAITQPPVKTTPVCFVPYPILYAQVDGDLYQAGIFSHAVLMGGTNLCSYTSVRSYYTLLGDFIPFIRGIVGKDVGYKAPDNSTTPQANPNFGVIFAAATSDKDASLISGDLLAPRDDSKPTLPTHTRATPTSVKSSSSEATSTKTTSSDQSTATLGDASDTSNNSESDSAVDSSPSGLSKRAITIIAAVCGSLGTLLLVALGIFLYRWYRGHIRRIHDPYHAPSVRDMLEDMFNNPDDQPPPPLYRPQDRPSTRAAKAAEDAARKSLKK